MIEDVNLKDIKETQNISEYEQNKDIVVNPIIEYNHDSEVIKEMSSQDKIISRYKTFCKAFDLNVDDILYVYGWGFYYVGETCFYLFDTKKGEKKYCKYPPYELIINRGYLKQNLL